MTSTQVQRTLVKSAPEIWAELSDPAALARHLDPVGEIRITRTEPEEKVEWEADRARGTVLIKSSGWGTRVTLTMDREADAPAGQADQATSPTDRQPLGEPAPQTTGRHEPEAEVQPEALAPQPANDSPPESVTEVAPESPSEGVTDAAPVAVPESPSEGVSGAVFEPMSETVAEREAVPEAPSEGVSRAVVEPMSETVAEPEVSPAHEAVGETAESGAESLETSEREAPAHPPQRLPRRGFLARLLGRRRWPDGPASGGGESFLGLSVRTPGRGPWPTAPAEWVSQFPRREPDSEIAPAAAEPEPSLEDTLGEEQGPPEENAPDTEQLADEEPALRLGAVGGAVGDDTEAVAEAQTDDPGDHRTGSTEQDAAVLSAVLDRLGAAHHRPFSRS
jgi:hypothetical protein